MAQECGFFDAQLVGDSYDRVYLAAQFAAYFASFIRNGIFGHSMQQLEVSQQDVSDMSIKVLGGQAWINGYWYRNTGDYTMNLDIADGILSRIDTVVLRWSNSDRAMYLHVIKGTLSANPTAPAIVRDADYYDLGLAHVSIPAGCIRVTQAQITDLRLNNNFCGLVTGLVDQIDLTDLWNQFEQYFYEFKEKYQKEFDDWTDEQEQALNNYIVETKAAYSKFVTDMSNDYTTWTNEKKDEWSQWVTNQMLEFTTWVDNEKIVYNTWTAQQRQAYMDWYTSHTTAWEAMIEKWFEDIKGNLSGDPAVSLQLQIDELNSNLTDLKVGEVAGGKNLLDVNIMSDMIANIGTPIYKQIKLKPNTTYTMSSDFDGESFAVAFGGGYITENMTTPINGVFKNSPKTFSSDSNGYVTLCYRAIGDVKNFENLKTYKWQIEEGSEATEYEPYIKSNYQLGIKTTQIDDANMLGYVLPEEMPIKNYVDSDGVFHQRVGRVDLGTLDWSYSSEYKRFSTRGITDYKKKDSGSNTWVADAFLKGYSTTSGNNTASDSYNKSIGFNGTSNMFFVKNTSYTDATSFKNAMQGQYLYYELATEKTISVDGNEYINTYKADKSEVCVNLLKPTLTIPVTKNGISCSVELDGVNGNPISYMFDGTATADAEFILFSKSTTKYRGKTLRLTGCPSGGSSSTYYLTLSDLVASSIDTGNGLTKTFSSSSTGYDTKIIIKSGTTVSNLHFKPMITTDLTATYDDFVPYTGDKGRINEEVAELNKKVTGIFTLDGTTLNITTE